MRRRHWLAGAGATAAAVLGGGCSLLPRTPTVPMPTLRPPGPCAGSGTGRAPVLLVMLPGAYSLPQEFVDKGFVSALRERGIAADVVVADSHLGYFGDRSVLRRLRDDVVAPARAQGYRQVWLVGISLGGFGALAYATAFGNHPAQGVDGVLALAPYLGGRRLLREIADSGGPAAWRATPQAGNALTLAQGGDADAGEREIWRWLATPPPGAPPVYLGFGREDRLGEGHRTLMAVLPPDRVFEVPGGHDWPPWRALWQAWLARGLLPLACNAAGG